MTAAPTFRELVAHALHDYYCEGEGATPGEPCLGMPEDIEGWTPVAERLKELMTEAGYRIHRVGSCVHPAPPAGREMTREEQIAVGLVVPRTPIAPPGIDPKTDMRYAPEDDPMRALKKEAAAVINPDEFVFGDVP